jgi:predicted AAA+ superfamily ATPase
MVSATSRTHLVDRICLGGWPALLDAGSQEAGIWLRDYLNQIVHVDIQGLGVRRRDPENFRRLLNSLARNVGTAAKVTALAKDVGGAEGPVARATVDGYLDSLSRLRLTENSPAWAPAVILQPTALLFGGDDPPSRWSMP